MLLPSPYHLGPSLHIFLQEENVFVYHVPRHHDYNHTELHQTQDRELVFSCHQLEVFLATPGSSSKLRSSPASSVSFNPHLKRMLNRNRYANAYYSASIGNTIPGWDWLSWAVTSVCGCRGVCRASATFLFHFLVVMNHFYDLYYCIQYCLSTVINLY